MGENKHTPGPWRVGITKHAVYQVAAPELRVALCSDDEDKGGREVERANARLIAAAPLMLEALRKHRGLWDRIPTEAELRTARADFDAAIKAATGGEP